MIWEKFSGRRGRWPHLNPLLPTCCFASVASDSTAGPIAHVKDKLYVVHDSRPHNYPPPPISKAKDLAPRTRSNWGHPHGFRFLLKELAA